jgi:hypothetical protein
MSKLNALIARVRADAEALAGMSPKAGHAPVGISSGPG